MRRSSLALGVVLAACGGGGSTPIDATPDAATDGTYTCTAQSTGDSCSAPVLQAGLPPWSLGFAGVHLTITATGFDTPTIECDGTWSGTQFDCPAVWQRAGRVCNLPLHVRVETSGALTFWINTVTSSTATCART